MKTLKFAGLVLIAFIFSIRANAQSTEAQNLTVPLSDPGKPFKLEVSLVSGAISVSVYDGKDVAISAVSTQRKREDRNAVQGGMHRISGGDNLDVIANEKNNNVNITSGLPSKSVMLNIKIPRGVTNVKLTTVNNGAISAESLDAAIEVNNTNGAIKLSNVSGSVVANTTNGKVTVTFKNIDPKAPMAFTTLNGDVDVTFPAGLKANVKARSDNGNVYSDFDMVTEKSPAKATKTEEKGMYRITVEDWIYGKIAGGGPEMLFKNMNGSIYIRKAK